MRDEDQFLADAGIVETLPARIARELVCDMNGSATLPQQFGGDFVDRCEQE